MYILCKSLKWTHLPAGGGIYDQHPKLLDDFLIIMAIEADADRRDHEKQKREIERNQKKNRR